MLSRSVLPLLRPVTAGHAGSGSGSGLARLQVRIASSSQLPHRTYTQSALLAAARRSPTPQTTRRVPKAGAGAINVQGLDPAHDPEALKAASLKQQEWKTEQTELDEGLSNSKPQSSSPKPQEAEAEADFEPPNTPLPDLTRGIPSTIDAELAQASKVKDPLNITEEGQDPRATKDGTGSSQEPPRSSYVSSSDQRRSALTKYFYMAIIFGSLGYGLYNGRNWSQEEAEQHRDIPQGYTPALIYARARARWGSTVSYYTDPVTKKLLPDVPPNDPNMPPYTLVIGLEDVLVHSEWSREHGWRIAKRPGLDYFIKYLTPYYELVVFSTQPAFTVDQIHRKIDPFQMMYPLFREMTVYEDNGYVKDLSYLNRDLKKVVAIDSDKHHVKKQPENAIVIPPWTGDPKDTTLIDLIPFLENLASLGYSDTREVLKSFEGKDIAKEFDRRQKLLREKFEAQQAEKRKGRRGGGLGLGSMLGPRQRVPGQQSIAEAELEGKMYSDIIRERGQENYLRLEQHLKTEGPKIIAEREALEKKMQEDAMADMKSGMFGFFGSKKE